MLRVEMAMTSKPGAVRSDDQALTLEEFLPYRLAVLAATVSGALARIYADRFRLTIPQWRIIATLGQFETCTGRDIAGHGMMHKSTVSRAVSALENRGLVERRSNPDDMREEHLRLTPEGRAIYDEVAPEALGFETRLTSALEPAERRTLFALLARLDARARDLAPNLEVSE
jgi:DNA-binding MarR family transcriptional regulator